MAIILKPRQFRPRITDQPDALGASSIILHARARQHYWSGTGSLSIKSFDGGEALYDVGCGRYKVDQDSYLLLNQGQPYEINIDAKRDFESFCVFFEDGFAEEVHYSLTTPIMTLLDNPENSRPSRIHFFEKNYLHDEILSPVLFRFKASLPDKKDDDMWINQQLHEIIQSLLRVHHSVYQEVESLPAIRAATREELYRRLHRAKEFISASFDQPITIDHIARVACLSSNHFLRTFQQAFRQTPHQFLTTKRLEQAQKLLLRTDLPITDICLSIGFESLGSFSSLFRRKFGVSPDKYRRKKGDFEEAR